MNCNIAQLFTNIFIPFVLLLKVQLSYLNSAVHRCTVPSLGHLLFNLCTDTQNQMLFFRNYF